MCKNMAEQIVHFLSLSQRKVPSSMHTSSALKSVSQDLELSVITCNEITVTRNMIRYTGALMSFAFSRDATPSS